MPFHLPFNMPYFFNPRYRYSYNNSYNMNMPNNNTKIHNEKTEKKTEDSKNNQSALDEESSDYFFEIFGLKLYFDDILIMCLLFFLYTEGVQDQELFLCLILLLIS